MLGEFFLVSVFISVQHSVSRSDDAITLGRISNQAGLQAKSIYHLNLHFC